MTWYRDSKKKNYYFHSPKNYIQRISFWNVEAFVSQIFVNFFVSAILNILLYSTSTHWNFGCHKKVRNLLNMWITVISSRRTLLNAACCLIQITGWEVFTAHPQRSQLPRDTRTTFSSSFVSLDSTSSVLLSSEIASYDSRGATSIDNEGQIAYYQ
jgi:hypothetical protein